MGLETEIQVMEVGGKDQFSKKLPGLKASSEFRRLVTSIGIIRDADDDPKAAFQSVCSALKKADLPIPTAPIQSESGPPKVTVMIIPDSGTPGMIENICLDSVSDDPAIACVDQYFQCLQSIQRTLAENDLPKAKVRAFLASREWLELVHFEYLQKCLRNYVPVIPVSPAAAVPKLHLFLASRYTPNLDLGTAAQKSEREDRYWQFDHPAFDNIKQFLYML